METLTIDMTKRLPDINQYSRLPPKYSDYGRFAIISNGNLWFAGIASSHPPNTRDGFYWARTGNTLYISPRGSSYGFPEIITKEIIAWLLGKLRVRVKQVRVVK